MSLLETLRSWHSATTLWKSDKRSEALAVLESITEPDAKILYNIATAHLALGNIRDARQIYTTAISKDVHCALAYFQRGLTLYKLGSYADALTNFEDAESRMRGKKFIDYTQLGLRYKLYGCEVMYNASLCHYKLGNKEMGAQVMEEAKAGITEKRHIAITEGAAKIQMGQEADIMGESNTALFLPSKNKVTNLSKKDYLGTAKVISSLDSSDLSSGFSGPTRRHWFLIDQARSPPRSPGGVRKMSAPEIVLRQPTNSSNQTKSSGSKNSGPNKDVHSELEKMMMQMTSVGQGHGVQDMKDDDDDFVPPLSPRNLSHIAVPPEPAYMNLRRGTAPQLGDLKSIHDLPRFVVEDTDSAPPGYPPPRPPLGSSNAPTRPLPGPANVTPPRRPPKNSPPSSPTITAPEHVPSPTNNPPPRPTSAKPVSKSPQMARRDAPRSVSPSPGWTTKNAASLPPPPNRPPPKLGRESTGGNRAPPPPCRPPKPQKVVIKFHCNSTQNVQVERGESVASLLETAQQLFELEPNTFNLWSRDTDSGDWSCIMSDSDMLKIWSQPNLLQLWCFNKE